MSELWRHSASELAALIARKEASSREVVEAHLARIATVNPKLNAVVKVLAEEARKGADEADRKVAAKDALGPLHGVPFTIKENIDLAGAATTWGLPAFARAVVPLDAPVVERMREAGAAPIGRTNLPDSGTDRGRFEQRLWPQVCRLSLATTSAARCAIPPTPAASRRSGLPKAACPTRASFRRQIARWPCR
jgi:Asp-tRNA(Asn)/Glu-tRNA(Gln) amidotransferase A subunit family amidase